MSRVITLQKKRQQLKNQYEQLISKAGQLLADIEKIDIEIDPEPKEMTEAQVSKLLGYPVTFKKDKVS